MDSLLDFYLGIKIKTKTITRPEASNRPQYEGRDSDVPLLNDAGWDEIITAGRQK